MEVKINLDLDLLFKKKPLNMVNLVIFGKSVFDKTYNHCYYYHYCQMFLEKCPYK